MRRKLLPSHHLNQVLFLHKQKNFAFIYQFSFTGYTIKFMLFKLCEFDFNFNLQLLSNFNLECDKKNVNNRRVSKIMSCSRSVHFGVNLTAEASLPPDLV